MAIDKNSISAQEWRTRCDTAMLYRIMARLGWGDFIFTHITHRIMDAPDQFFIQPFGMMFGEVTASSLLKVSLDGQIIAGDTDLNPAGFSIHAAVYRARPDVNCVIHLHTDAGVAVSSQACGLRPISQTALIVGHDLAYHDYEGITFDADEQARLTTDLGHKHTMLLRHHGTLAVGADAGSAFLAMYQLERACQIQIAALTSACLDIDQGVGHRVAAQIKRADSGQDGRLAYEALLRWVNRVAPDYCL